MTSASNRPIHTGLPRFAGWRRCAPPTGGEACCEAPAAPGRGHGICVDHHAQPARQIRQRLRPLGRLHGQALVDDAQELLAVLGQAQLGQGLVGVLGPPFRRGRRTQAGDQRVHHRAQPIHRSRARAATEPCRHTVRSARIRARAAGSCGVSGHHQLRQRWARAPSSMPTVSSEMSPQISPCACKRHQRRQQIGQQALDARSPARLRRGRGDGAQGTQRQWRGAGKGPRGVNRPADDDMFKAVLGTCVPGNDGY